MSPDVKLLARTERCDFHQFPTCLSVDAGCRNVIGAARPTKWDSGAADAGRKEETRRKVRPRIWEVRQTGEEKSEARWENNSIRWEKNDCMRRDGRFADTPSEKLKKPAAVGSSFKWRADACALPPLSQRHCCCVNLACGQQTKTWASGDSAPAIGNYRCCHIWKTMCVVSQ